ncbi:lipoate--protein ligase [Caloranaerobacter azorensis]|uniref:lipoate--protein ligase n=1 Tax=Caloranaerobacter azorensis TaxID=116090 RepID=A0A6P1YF53_9FIRM|nr:lipoate--protein ligase [Caloranaerobacter azorensis]QIB27562.1 lipoate--protein ligase [Caloranaerobacter azorensis]
MPNKKVQTKIIQSLSFDPWYNLALEEYLLNKVSENQMILYLWQNENTVVIGRNQNPWKECRCRELESEGGKLARRLSGGGAVFHDLGNLNFTFIMDKKLYNLENQLKIILRAVKKLGIEAEFSGRNDLTVQGKKFSGNAFYFDTSSAYHHGTLLINTDFQKLNRYLQVSKEKLNSKGIDSIQSRVVNLSSIRSCITIEDMVKSLEESFIETYGETIKEIHKAIFTEEIEKLYHKYASWEWRYGETPSFDITFQNRFSWGDIDIGLKLENGYIKSSLIYSDAIDYDLIQKISQSLEGVPFCKEDIINRIESIPIKSNNRTIIEDLKEWFSTKNI